MQTPFTPSQCEKQPTSMFFCPSIPNSIRNSMRSGQSRRKSPNSSFENHPSMTEKIPGKPAVRMTRRWYRFECKANSPPIELFQSYPTSPIVIKRPTDVLRTHTLPCIQTPDSDLDPTYGRHPSCLIRVKITNHKVKLPVGCRTYRLHRMTEENKNKRAEKFACEYF